MAGPVRFWSVKERLAEISAQGDPLGTLAAAVDFEVFRPVLVGALGETPRRKGGRPGIDAVLKFAVRVLQSPHGLSLEATEHLVRDWLSSMRFCRLGPGDRVPDADASRGFREALIRAGALEALVAELDRAITAAGTLLRGGQTVDATLVATPRQRLAEEEKLQAKKGGSAAEIRPEKPAKARGTLRRSKPKARAEAAEDRVALAAAPFGHKSHVRVDRMHGIVRRQVATCAARHDDGRLREGPIQRAHTARDAWADSASRSAENEAGLAERGMRSRIHRPGAAGPTETAAARSAASSPGASERRARSRIPASRPPQPPLPCGPTPDARSLARMEIGALAAHVEEAQRLCETLDALGAPDALGDRRRDPSPEAEVGDLPHGQENSQEPSSVVCNAGGGEASTGGPARDGSLPRGPHGAERCQDHEDAAARAARKAGFLHMLTAERLCGLASHDMQALVRDSQRDSSILREVHLIDAATRTLPVLGINHDAREKAIEAMGPESATIAVLLLDANRDHPRTPVRNPRGALRAMTLRHRRGTLNLVGSLMGLARRRAA